MPGGRWGCHLGFGDTKVGSVPLVRGRPVPVCPFVCTPICPVTARGPFPACQVRVLLAP